MMTGRLLVPVTDGLAVCDPADGALERVIRWRIRPGPAR